MNIHDKSASVLWWVGNRGTGWAKQSFAGKVVSVSKHHAPNAYRAPRILDLSTRWKQAVSFPLLPIWPGKELHCRHWIWQRPRTGLDEVAKRKISAPTGNEATFFQPIVKKIIKMLPNGAWCFLRSSFQAVTTTDVASTSVMGREPVF